MNWLSHFLERRKGDLGEEIRVHLEMDIADRISRGESPEHARSAAQRQFGNAQLVQEVTHNMWHWTRFERVLNDLRFAVRVLRRSLGFTLTMVLTLAIGVGATCAMFTVVGRVLLRPIRFKDPSRLVKITETGRRGPDGSGSAIYLDIAQWGQRSHVFEAISFYDENNRAVWFLDDGNATAHVSSASVSANLFPMLGVQPALGRGFLWEDSVGSVKPEDSHAILLSDAVWREDYGADPRVIGTTTRLNGESLTVIGVMPRDVVFPYGSGDWNGLPVVWRPIVLGDSDKTRDHHAPHYQVLARLGANIPLSQAESELRVIQNNLANAYSDPFDRDHVSSVMLTGYARSLMNGNLRKATLSLFGASALLWLIACVNAAGLMVARYAARQREFAVRGALGASRFQILQQLLIEAVILSVSASMFGIVMAIAMLKFFEHDLVTQFNLHEKLMPDLPVVAALIGLTILGALGIAVWPALALSRTAFEKTLRQGSPQVGMSKSQHRLRGTLVITEIALSLTLLVGCGLLLRTIYALRHVPLGFRTDHILVANMTIPSYRFSGRDMTIELYEPLSRRIRGLPGVESASLMTEVPLGTTFSMIFSMRPSGHSAIDWQRHEMKTQFRAVGPEMQKVFGFRMLRGRFFNEDDTSTSQAVVVVNRAFVKAYFADDRDPSAILGESLVGLGKNRRAIVVGVLDDERQVSVAESSQPELEVCIPQITPDSMFYKAAEGTSMDVAVRTARDPIHFIPELRNVLRASSSDLAASTFTTMDQVVKDSIGSQRLAAELLEIFAGSALFLTLAGVYGVLAYFVAQRQRDLGVRIALGAQRSHIIRLIVRQAFWMLGTGLIFGMGTAYLASKWLTVFLYGVKTNDPWTEGAVAILLLVGGMIASLVPARRAASVNPVDMIRAE
jgi:putative ABC transport system permease protein